MIAVGGDDVVVVAEHRDGTGAARFLADVEVAEAADAAEGVGLGAAFLEAALQEHGVEEGRACWRVRLAELRFGAGLGLLLRHGREGGHPMGAP